MSFPSVRLRISETSEGRERLAESEKRTFSVAVCRRAAHGSNHGLSREAKRGLQAVARSPDVAAALGARVGLDAVAAFLRSHADVAVQNLQPTTRIQVTEIGVCTHPESIGIGPSSNRERSRQSKNGSVMHVLHAAFADGSDRAAVAVQEHAVFHQDLRSKVSRDS